MIKSQAQVMAHELTIEYIRAHPDILSGDINSIKDAVDKIADINVKFYEALATNEKFNKIL